VTFLARKINRAKWDPVEGFADGEIAADAVTVDLRTTGNTLSFWTCASAADEEINATVLALMSVAERIDKIDVTWIQDAEVRSRGLAVVKTDGRTPVESLRERHVDIARLDLHRLGSVAKMISKAVADNQHRRLTN